MREGETDNITYLRFSFRFFPENKCCATPKNE